MSARHCLADCGCALCWQPNVFSATAHVQDRDTSDVVPDFNAALSWTDIGMMPAFVSGFPGGIYQVRPARSVYLIRGVVAGCPPVAVQPRE